MKQCFRIALWMFFIIGYLQAKPVKPTQNKPDKLEHLGISNLQQHVKCGNDVKFASPQKQDGNEMVKCFNASLQSFKEGLEHATWFCEDKGGYINETLEALDDFPSTISTDCTLDTKESQFKDFVKDLEEFAQIFNSYDRTLAN